MSRPSALVAFAILICGLTPAAHAGYLNLGDLSAGPRVPAVSDFTYNGSTTTKWDPGPDSASIHNFDPPNGPRTLGGATWSIMPAGISGTSVEGTHNDGADSTSMDLLGGGDLSNEIATINAAMNEWASHSGFSNLGMVSDGGADMGASKDNDGHLGDMRFGAYSLDGSFGTLAHAIQPISSDLNFFDATLGGDVHFDNAENWVDDPNEDNIGSDIDFFTVALHEIGHALGLGHSSVEGSVMEPNYEGARRSLGADDIAGIQALYDTPEPSSLAFAALGACGLFGYGWRRRRRRHRGSDPVSEA